MTENSFRPLQPADFRVNQTWLAYKANHRPLLAGEAVIDVFVLQDAGSMFVFGNAFAPAGADSPTPQDAAGLLKQAWSTKQEWAAELLLPGQPTVDNGFARAAEWNGMAVRFVPPDLLSVYIEDVQSSYEEFLNRESEDDA